ncbi:MAG: alanine--glyoxylate aminotransferase family protein [Candidatus Omnitrophica bacterium]|nr:alanine--glyoxylate aminotransferase family protein [Candidatus Omnitrophota bacterium]MBU4488642.1 alanine--glyoxylate aminotransferase family protein [Candidatus Omnitrophota bacterium]
MKKTYVMAPGPTMVPEEVLLEMAKPMIHHRTSQYKDIFKKANDGLKYVLKTTNDVFTLTSSGTGAMETAVVNLLSKDDTVIVVRGGKFGERFGEICQAYGVKVIPIDVDWSRAVDPELVKKALAENKNAKAVFATLCETSAGTRPDIEALGKIVAATDAVLVIDAISGLGADNLETDKWNVDVVCSGSQKGLMLPPGLAFISMSKKAMAMVAKSNLPKFYFSIKEYKKALDKDDVPWTPAISLVRGLCKVIDIMKEEGIDNIIARHARLANATREAVKAMGLKLYSTSPSNAVTPVIVPEGIDGEALVKTMRTKYGVTIAGGQAELKGKAFRIAHLGYMVEFDTLTAIAALEIVLKEMGYKFTVGSGVAAAVKALA